MAVADRAEFGDYCLRKLGAPVIQISVTDEQISDRIDEALWQYQQFHYDGSEKTFLVYQVTQDMRDDKYITLPDDVLSVTRMLPYEGVSNGTNIFDYRYQVALNDLYTLTAQSMVPYYVTMQHLDFIQDILVGKKPIRFNRVNSKLHVDSNWADMAVDTFIVLEVTRIVSETDFAKIWNDRWLQKYATALIREQWGNNMNKYQNVQMLGGIVFNGGQIVAQAKQEIQELEAELEDKYMEPLGFFIG